MFYILTNRRSDRGSNKPVRLCVRVCVYLFEMCVCVTVCMFVRKGRREREREREREGGRTRVMHISLPNLWTRLNRKYSPPTQTTRHPC